MNVHYKYDKLLNSVDSRVVILHTLQFMWLKEVHCLIWLSCPTSEKQLET